MQRESGTLNLIIGRSGSGKTDFLLRKLYHQAPDRVIAWDPAQQFCLENGFVRVDHLQHLVQVLKGNAGAARIAFVPSLQASPFKQFESFCQMAYLWCLEAPCWICVDELADVSNAGKAPAAWGNLVRTIRKFGAEVWAATQRPQEIDKTILGNLHQLVVFAPQLEKDRQYIVREIGMPLDSIPTNDFHFTLQDRLNNRTPGRLAPPK